MIFRQLVLTVLAGFAALSAAGMEVTVAEPYIEFRTGPGRGYPVYHVVDEGQQVTVLKRRTNWFKVRGPREREGWIHRDQLERTLAGDGEPPVIEDASFGNFSNRRWEMGVGGGDFGGANVISVYGAYALSPNLSLEGTLSKGLGAFSDSEMASVELVHQLFPDKRVSPMFMLGTGVMRTSPSATLVESEDRTDQTAHVGLGARAYLTRQFVFRLEYKSYVVFTTRDDNEEVEEWKAGFSFFL